MSGEIVPTEKEARAAFNAEQKIIKIVNQLRHYWVDLAEALHFFHEKRQWGALGYDSFEQWCASPHVDLGRRQIFHLMSVYREFVISYGASKEQIEQIGPAKLREVAGAIRREEVTLHQALADAATLSRSDLLERYSDTHSIHNQLNAQDEPEWAICSSCGSRYKVRST